MNRIKKEEKRKYDKARKHLSEEQIEALNKKDARQREIEELARKIHTAKFPEEYDFMYDSVSDAKDRARGKNPMNQEYIEKINSKRKSQSVEPLSESGRSTSNDTMTMCIEEAKKTITE